MAGFESDDSLVTDTDEEETVLMFDNGSHEHRAGFCGDDDPRSVFKSVVGKTQGRGKQLGGLLGSEPSMYVGDEALEKSSEVTWPVREGKIQDMDAMEHVWHRVYSDLRAVNEEHQVIMTVKPRCHNHDKEAITEVMFERFRVPGLFLVCDAAMTIMCTGRTTGLVLDCGHDKCVATPVYENFPLYHASRASKMSSALIHKFLLSNEAGADAAEVWKLQKERSQIYASKEAYQESLKNEDMAEQQKNIDTAFEAYFQPSLLENNREKSLVDIVKSAMQATDAELQKELLNNIVLGGGGSMVRGIEERLKMEFQLLYPDQSVKVIAPPERKTAVWTGGSIYGSLSFFEGMPITKAEYEECGPYIARRKCFA